MAGVSYDVIDESQLTNINNLIGYDALIFPAMANVNAAQLPAIMSALTSAVYDYHIGIITSGDFLTNDQTGAALPNPYANMQTLLGLTRADGGNSGDVTVTANDVNNPIMKGYTAGQNHPGRTVGVGYNVYQAVGTTPRRSGQPERRRCRHTCQGWSRPRSAVPPTCISPPRLCWATAICCRTPSRRVVLGTSPGVALHTSRMARHRCRAHGHGPGAEPSGRVAGRAGPGIYDQLIPILKQWKAAIRFRRIVLRRHRRQSDERRRSDNNRLDEEPAVLSGDPGAGRRDRHTLLHPSDQPAHHDVHRARRRQHAGGLDNDHPRPACRRSTGSRWACGSAVPASARTRYASGAVVHTQVTAVSGNTITISYDPDGAGPAGNHGTLGDLSDGQTLTFSIPSENTNFLEPATGTDLSGPAPVHLRLRVRPVESRPEQTQLGTTIYGAAVPGAAENLATARTSSPISPRAAATPAMSPADGPASSPAIRARSATSTRRSKGSVYIAPNMTFDFTEIQYQGKTVAQAEADWAAQFSALTSHAAGTPIVVWPIHDYGAAAWNTTTNSPD